MDFIFNNLPFIWFSVFVALLIGYAVLDGFDLGVGMLHLFAKKDIERRIMLNSIGPVWDGNEVWLVTAGGALFAGFPVVYASLCSAFYIPVMILLNALIFRAVAIEFRSKQQARLWRLSWDVLFALSSLIISLALGMAIGNLICGIPLDKEGEFTGSLSTLVNPYACLTAVMTASLFMMHGSIYLMMKTEGEFHEKMRTLVNPCIIFFIMTYAITTAATLIYCPHVAETVRQRGIMFLVAIVNMFAIANIPREINLKRDARAFLSSCINICCLIALYGLSTYPNIVRASNAPEELSLTIWNSASSDKTLSILLLISLIGIPLVLSYTVTVYWIFKGKVKLESTSY